VRPCRACQLSYFPGRDPWARCSLDFEFRSCRILELTQCATDSIAEIRPQIYVRRCLMSHILACDLLAWTAMLSLDALSA
jgi:hypothetical protein